MKNYEVRVHGQAPDNIIENTLFYVDSLTSESWLEFSKPKETFNVFAAVDSICVLNYPDRQNPVYKKMILNQQHLFGLSSILKFVLDVIHTTNPCLEFKRILLHKLKPFCKIPEHVDPEDIYHFSSLRVHVPLTFHDKVEFFVNYKPVKLVVGSIFEINNQMPHEVLNNSPEDRIHLLMDFNDIKDPYYS